MAENIGKLEKYNGWEWDAEYAYTDDFDPCLALSYIVVPIVGGTSSSPYHIMLFRKGEYLGTATQEPRGFAPRITQTSDDSISVGYRFARVSGHEKLTGGGHEKVRLWP
ncbi:LppP/LprE family lipoprotein [Corynebacterium sp. SA-MJD20WY100]|uniref:LppP/LprE family lipoprotein n=1 Tax=Corynebacterium sp. SA-MJD20WY100 TaxID=3142969 RepID=UPI003221672D